MNQLIFRGRLFAVLVGFIFGSGCSENEEHRRSETIRALNIVETAMNSTRNTSPLAPMNQAVASLRAERDVAMRYARPQDYRNDRLYRGYDPTPSFGGFMDVMKRDAEQAGRMAGSAMAQNEIKRIDAELAKLQDSINQGNLYSARESLSDEDRAIVKRRFPIFLDTEADFNTVLAAYVKKHEELGGQ